ncbi:hypothetical protein KW423_00240 [Vibrio fluvialis]|nr:hypothetical protein [Vibrio fluvialis]
MALVSAYYAKSTLWIISSGMTREDLTINGGVSFVMLFFSPFFKVITPFCLYFGSSLRLRFCLLLGLFCSLLYGASMAELLYFGFIILTLYSLFSIKNIWSLVLPFLLLIFFSFLIARYAQTVRYGENIDLYSFSLLVLEKILKYRAFSFYLSDILINSNVFSYKLLYPFFGYPYEWIISKFYPDIIYFDSNFIVSYHYLGGDNNNPYLANVIYPWWSFYFYSFGPFGLILKALWCFLILRMLLMFRFFFTAIYSIALLLYIGQFSFPLISINALATIFLLIAVDLAVRLRGIK